MDDAFALLRLQFEWGADEAIEPEPIDRMRPLESPPPPPASVRATRVEPLPSRAPSATPPATPSGTPAERALAAAGQARSLDDLRAAIAAFDGCALRDTASHLVFAEGDPASSSLIIGEPPGREEDRSGHPFAGAEGQLLDQMLASIALNRSHLMLTPLLPWRPPGARPPSATEIALCLPFLHRLIALLNPRRIVLFGDTAARVLLPQAANRRRTPRGWIDVRIPGMHETPPVMALPGLGEMLKKPPLRRDAWAGLRSLRRRIDEAQTET